MRLFLTVLAIFTLLTGQLSAETLTVERGTDLQSIIDYAADGDTLVLGMKTFEAQPRPFTDSLCGNCQEHRTPVDASYGFIIKGKSLVLVGKDRNLTRLVTKAGYGLYFEDSPNSQVLNLTITGGIRDAAEAATSGAVVVRRSGVELFNVDIVDNDHRDTSVTVGLCGVVGREGSDLNIKNCSIINCSWDGVALYRGASAQITDCIIKNGRGAGIGVTWDATCIAYRNNVSGFWKGIGSFGSSWLVARNNLVHDCLGWGVIATEQSYLDLTNNVIYRNGNCGVAPWSTSSSGRIVNNIITANGWREEWVCPCVGVWNYADWAKWRFTNNIVWGNEAGNYRDIWDQTGFNGNLSEDPLFAGENDFRLQPGSPGLNAGDSTLYNPDGSISHIGLHGGPQAKRTPPLGQ